MISLACANIPLKAYVNVFKAMAQGRIGRGKYVSLLEERASRYFGSRHCIAVGNGTLADIIMLRALKELYPQKTEVILPALTFIAHANAVLWAGLRPIFVDVDFDYQINEAQAHAAINEKTLCIFPVHLIGKQAFKSNKLITTTTPVLEDCCEAMGGIALIPSVPYLRRARLGKIGTAASFSMYPSHTITTGEGGLIITDDDNFARLCRSIHNHGKKEDDFDFEVLGINAKMTNLQAAIGCELIQTIDNVNSMRRDNVSLYNRILGENFYASAPHCYPIIYGSKKQRDNALIILKSEGIEARKLMGCIPFDKPYTERFGWFVKGYFPNAERFADCGLFVPVHQNLTEKEIKTISDVIKRTRQ